MAEKSKWKIYISSTFKDLKDFRYELINLFQNQLQNNFELCKIMERMFNDGSYRPFVEDCMQAVEDSDIYIIILGNKTGSFPPNENRTYTEIELDTAIKSEKRIFCLRLKDFDFNEIDNPEKHQELLNKFQGKPIHSFEDLAELKNCIYECLLPFASESPINKKNPYKGLSAFNVDDGNYFFGRDTEIKECLKKISICEGNVFISIIGNSGIGKSSFVQAGLLHRLKTEVELGFSTYTQVIVSPGPEPFTNLKYQLKLKGVNIEDLVNKNDLSIELILFFNQFEEVISQCHSEESIKERDQLFQFLDSISNSKKKALKIIIITTFRSDFLSQLANFEFIKKHQIFFPLNSLDYTLGANNWKKSIEEIIVKPALQNGVEIERTLVSQLTNEIKEVEGSLSILQFTLEKIWNENTIRDRIIDSSEYNGIADGKGISGILESHAESVVNRITKNGTDKEQETILKSIFINLVEVNENLLDVKRTAKKEELFTKLKGYYDHNSVTAIFEDLVSEQSRLLVLTQDKKNTSNVDIIHEVLIRKWQRLRNWIDERREALIYQQDLKKDISDYGKGQEKLYSKSKWKVASTWQINNPDLNDVEIKSFIEKSKKRTRLRVYTFMGLLVTLLPLYLFFVPMLDKYEMETYIKRNPQIREQIGDRAYYSVPSLQVRGDEFILSKIAYFKKLRKLKIYECNFKNFSEIQGKKWLNGLNSIDSLTIQRNMNLTSLKGIGFLSNLKYLNIEYNGNLSTLEGIENIINLKSLNITNNNLKDLKGIPMINALVRLNISGGLNDLKGIENLSNLKSLEITNILIRQRNLSSLRKIQKLNELNSLTISGLDSLKDLTGFGNLPSLTQLRITENTELNSLKGIENFENLKFLYIKDNNNLKDLEGLSLVYSLNDLSFSGSLSRLEEIENLSNLRNLVIEGPDFGMNNLFSFRGIEKLQKLNYLKIKKQTSLKGIDEIETLPALTQLEIIQVLNLENLDEIKEFTNVKSLKIFDNSNLINLQGIEYLNKIEILKIAGNNNLQSFKGIEKLNNLKAIEILFYVNQANLKKIEPLLNFIGDLKTKTQLITIYSKLIDSKKSNKKVNEEELSVVFLWKKPDFKWEELDSLDDVDFLIMPKLLKFESTLIKNNNPGIKIFTY